MSKFNVKTLATAAALMLATAGAQGASDRFDPKSYPKGGFAPITNATYSKECGACHFTYLPGLLPARSWHALLQKSNDHFGESLTLSADTLRELDDYLTANAGDHSDWDGPPLILKHLKDSATPLRITELPMMGRNHHVVGTMLGGGAAPKARSLTNCGTCHTTAATGSFANRDLIVPGVTRAHGMF